MTAEVSSQHTIRDNLLQVTTAVQFLSNPKVQRCTIESKERFLRGKGLTDLEIQKAIERCGDLDMSSLTSELIMFQNSRGFNLWFKEKLLPLIVYGGFAYGCYWLYKNCIRQLLFVEQPKRKTTAECIEELRKSLDVVNASISSLRKINSHL
ncbi:unnamed protein product [Leptidea sinapis]|uniref:Peroxisomal membrane protein PEX14 n=1 Tax=Leptidea sinapis TaxID=189913 RepID=A0A5E4R653_9NEOP|nr:unnamed protein product [Leptidea sinapis]